MKEQIELMRFKLQQAIEFNVGAAIILKTSQELDELILEYTKINLLKGEKNNNKTN